MMEISKEVPEDDKLALNILQFTTSTGLVVPMPLT
jgi:hypothetical protein